LQDANRAWKENRIAGKEMRLWQRKVSACNEITILGYANNMKGKNETLITKIQQPVSALPLGVVAEYRKRRTHLSAGSLNRNGTPSENTSAVGYLQ